MSGNKSKPSKTGATVEVPEEEIETKEAKEETKKGDFSSKISKYMKKSSNKQKKERDPIIMVSAVVLIICCAIVIGYTIYDKNFADHTERNVEYGDSVNVEYVGSFYDYYDADGGVIFDTNIKSVGTNTEYEFAHEWNGSTKDYATWKVTVGSGGSLEMFENALIGHHPGETVRVCIPADKGYELKGGIHQDGKKTGNTVDTVRMFESTSAFKTFFGVDAQTGGLNTVTSPYGWDADYVVNSDGTVLVTYKVSAADIDKVFNEGDEVAYKVKEVTSSGIKYDLVFDWNDRMLKTFDESGNTIYITEYYEADVPAEGRLAGDYDYKIKTGDTSSDDREVSGASLYFVIKIVEFA